MENYLKMIILNIFKKRIDLGFKVKLTSLLIVNQQK